VPSNYVKKEKKSLFQKIIPRKLHNLTNSSSPSSEAAKSNHTKQVAGGGVANNSVNSSTMPTTTAALASNNNNKLVNFSRAVVKHKYVAVKYAFFFVY
jgi:Tfp pilus assembly protein FimT